jgi:ParB-like chromosome segregation protein Spo0J
MSRTAQLRIEYLPVAALLLNAKSARIQSKKQIKRITQSIKEFGFNVPILVGRDLKVIAGHGRLLACKQLGWSEVPVIFLDHLTEPQRRAFMTADNRLSETSSWDEQLLAESLRDLSVLDLEFSLEVTGFSMTEIDLRIEGLERTDSAKADRADAAPPAAMGQQSAGRAIFGSSGGTVFSAGAHWNPKLTAC